MPVPRSLLNYIATPVAAGTATHNHAIAAPVAGAGCFSYCYPIVLFSPFHAVAYLALLLLPLPLHPAAHNHGLAASSDAAGAFPR